MRATENKQRGQATDPLGHLADLLARKMEKGAPSAGALDAALVAQALRELLDGPGAQARALRSELQIHLIKASNGQGAKDLPPTPEREMLSTEEAATMMERSRPYVAMLVDAGTLEGGEKSKGGHRKVPKASVERWIARETAAKDGEKDYRKAAAEAGMYDMPEEAYIAAGARKPSRGA